MLLIFRVLKISGLVPQGLFTPDWKLCQNQRLITTLYKDNISISLAVIHKDAAANHDFATNGILFLARRSLPIIDRCLRGITELGHKLSDYIRAQLRRVGVDQVR